MVRLLVLGYELTTISKTKRVAVGRSFLSYVQ